MRRSPPRPMTGTYFFKRGGVGSFQITGQPSRSGIRWQIPIPSSVDRNLAGHHTSVAGRSGRRFQGKPVSFLLPAHGVPFWNRSPDRIEIHNERLHCGKDNFTHLSDCSCCVSLLLGSGTSVARPETYLRGRGDREGSLCLALVMFALEIGLFFFPAATSQPSETSSAFPHSQPLPAIHWRRYVDVVHGRWNPG